MTTPTQPQLDCTAVLMAGGRSSRMGRDKAWLDYHGRPLWQTQVEKLHFAREIVISARTETFPETPPGCRLIFDEMSGKGPLAGLHAALKNATFARVVLLAVDMPEMTGEYLCRLLECATSETGIVPEVGGFYQGLAAVYPHTILPLLTEVIAGTDASFQNLCRLGIAHGLMRPRPAAAKEEFLFKNWNTPQDEA